jgi:2-C-methyl-D-erythritol 2,4-cyclodiphosphate synthase
MRVGIGYDVHPLVAGRKLVLGGVTIPFEKGLSGYSDADVLTHAIMDALLGAVGLKDIGHQFPTGDPQYKDSYSIDLLAQVGEMVTSRGYFIHNVDSTVFAQAPKIAPYIDEMRLKISRALSIDISLVMVKATTTDGLGFAGRGEGIAACAVALIEE